MSYTTNTVTFSRPLNDDGSRSTYTTKEQDDTLDFDFDDDARITFPSHVKVTHANVYVYGGFTTGKSSNGQRIVGIDIETVHDDAWHNIYSKTILVGGTNYAGDNDFDGDFELPSGMQTFLSGATIKDIRFMQNGQDAIRAASTCTGRIYFTYDYVPYVDINTFTAVQQNDGTVKFTCKATGGNGSGDISYTIKQGSTVLHSFTGASGSAVTKTTSIQPSLSYGTAYTFTLSVSYSGTATASKTASATFIAPSIGTPTLSLSGSTLSWNAVSFSSYLTGTKKYYLYKNGEQFKSTSSTSYTIDAATIKNWGEGTYTLTVKAVGTGLSNTANGSTIYSASSNSVTYTITVSKCTAPTSCSVSQPLSYSAVNLQWSGAQGGSANDITGYNVKYCESEDGSSFGDWSDSVFVYTSPLSVDPPSTYGNYYKFAVQTCGSAGEAYYSDGWTESDLLKKDIPSSLLTFTDDPIAAGSTKPKAVHMTEMQALLRAMLTFKKCEPSSFTTIVSRSTSLRSWEDHIFELRSAADKLDSSHDTWIEIPAGLPSASVVEQLRSVLRACYNNR